jgi:hypothetical protein
MDEAFNPNGLSALNGTQLQYPTQPIQNHRPSVRGMNEQSQESNTLPPINGLPMQHYSAYNGHNGGSLPGSMPGSMPQTPITPHTPVSAASSAPPDSSVFPSQNNHNGIHHQQRLPTIFPMTTYPPGAQMYSTASPMTTLAPQQTGFPAAALSGRGVQSQYAAQQMMGQQNTLGRQPEPEQQPTHVVGQQGRRGVLPTAPNRPTPMVGGKHPIPPKNADGKFPCPHCTKTYLHAKHLKRHMLRRELVIFDVFFILALIIVQTPATDRTCANSAKIRFREVTFLSDISRNAPYDVACPATLII